MLKQKNERFQQQSIAKRNKLQLKETSNVGPIVLGVLFLVVVGSALLQIFKGM